MGSEGLFIFMCSCHIINYTFYNFWLTVWGRQSDVLGHWQNRHKSNISHVAKQFPAAWQLKTATMCSTVCVGLSVCVLSIFLLNFIYGIRQMSDRQTDWETGRQTDIWYIDKMTSVRKFTIAFTWYIIVAVVAVVVFVVVTGFGAFVLQFDLWFTSFCLAHKFGL